MQIMTKFTHCSSTGKRKGLQQITEYPQGKHTWDATTTYPMLGSEFTNYDR